MRPVFPLRSLLLTGVFALATLVTAACGGGGGGGGASGTTTSNASTSNSPSTPATSSTTSPTQSATSTPAVLANNAVAVSIDNGVSNVPNMPFVTVTVCTPGSTTACETIDHVLVDTGSWGLRVFQNQLPASMTLAQEKDGSGNLLAECMQFFDGYTWGAVKLADLHIAGETASSLPIQVIDPNYASVPSNCSSVGPARNTAAALGANGILGIGVFKHDCGAACVSTALPATYYGCTGSACTSIPLAEQYQVANPIPYFATDNNGSILTLPAMTTAAAPSLTGQLVFGIGTQSNNGLGSAQVIGVSPSNGTFTTVQNGTTYPRSILDSGSTGLFFQTSQLPVCASPNQAYYCPVSNTQLSATITGVNGINSAVTFTVGNAAQISQANPNNAAMPLLAGPAFVTSSTFDWGLPFFYGRSVYAAIEQTSTPGGTGPYVAY